MNNFNLIDHFGFACVDEGLNSPPEPTHHQILPPVDSSKYNRPQEKVSSMKGLAQPLYRKNRNKKCIDKGVEQTHNAHHTQHQDTLNIGSYHTDPVNDDDPDWGPRQDL